MSEKDIAQILGQVKMRYDQAITFFGAGECDKAEKEISTLRDVLDDIYDRPGEENTQLTKVDGT